MRHAFRKEFGKSQVEFDLAGEAGRMLLAEDPKSYVYHVLSYSAATNPRGTEEEKLLRLIDGPLVHLME